MSAFVRWPFGLVPRHASARRDGGWRRLLILRPACARRTLARSPGPAVGEQMLFAFAKGDLAGGRPTP